MPRGIQPGQSQRTGGEGLGEFGEGGVVDGFGALLDGVPPLAGGFFVGAGDEFDGFAQVVPAGVAEDDAAHLALFSLGMEEYLAPGPAPETEVDFGAAVVVGCEVSPKQVGLHAFGDHCVRFLYECYWFGWLWGDRDRIPISLRSAPCLPASGALWPLFTRSHLTRWSDPGRLSRRPLVSSK